MRKIDLVKKLYSLFVMSLLFVSVSCSSLSAKEEEKSSADHKQRSFGGYHPPHHGHH